MPTPLPRDLVDQTTAARLLSVSLSTVCRWIQAKKLRAWKIGGRWKVSRRDIDDFLQAACNIPDEPPPEAAKKPPGQAATVASLRARGFSL